MPRAQTDDAKNQETVRPNDDQALDLDNPEVHSVIKEAYETLKGLKAERAEVNAEIKAVVAGLENRGLNRHAIAAVFRRMDMNTTHAEGFGNTYVIASKALQLDLPIEPAETEAPTHH